MKTRINYPDTSNTRFSSRLDAGAETIAHLDEYLDFMHFVKYNKTNTSGLNHLEANVEKGLLDPPTRTELAVFALYREAVSVPYIRSIRGESLKDVNGLELASLLQKVRLHSARIYSIGTYSSLTLRRHDHTYRSWSMIRSSFWRQAPNLGKRFWTEVNPGTAPIQSKQLQNSILKESFRIWRLYSRHSSLGRCLSGRDFHRNLVRTV